MSNLRDSFFSDVLRKDLLRISTAGSVDDGKSTLIGRLLCDTKNVYEDTLKSIETSNSSVGSEENIDFALLTDGLKSEREQKITIDVAYRYFTTPKRSFILADTPGHEQYTRNMATGASTADVAIVLIDGRKGVLTQTKRHSFILSLLGVKHIAVVVNKMDLIDYSEQEYHKICDEYKEFARKLEMNSCTFFPVSALKGDNVINASSNMPWYKEPSLIEYLENLYIGFDENLIDFRFPVQGTIRPSQDYRGYYGQVISGSVSVGDEVVVLPSFRKTKVKSIETYDESLQKAVTSSCPVIRLEDEIDLDRGGMIVHPNNIPHKYNTLEMMVVWMSEVDLKLKGRYQILHTTNVVQGEISKIRYKIDVNTLHREDTAKLSLNEIGRIRLELFAPIYSDSYISNRLTGSVVLVDKITNSTVGAGLILRKEVEEDYTNSNIRKNIIREFGNVSIKDKELLTSQKGCTVWLTGLSGAGKSTIAKELERRLYDKGIHSIVLDGDNTRYGLCNNLGFSPKDREENIRRVSEVAKLFNDQAIVVIAAYISPTSQVRSMASNIIGEKRFVEIFLSTDIKTCEARDVKGLYKKARKGEISDFTGVSAPYEKPDSADLVIDTERESLDESVAMVLREILSRI